jgi:hypothetical protein
MSDQHPINDVKTPEDLERHTYKVMLATIEKFHIEQCLRLTDHTQTDVFLAIHQGAFNAIVGSMCKSVGLPVQIAAEIVVIAWRDVETRIHRYKGV